MVNRLRKNPLLAVGLLGGLVIAAAAAWWLGSPLFINQTVNEQFPLSVQATLPAEVSRPESEATMVETVSATQESVGVMPAEAVTLKTGTFRDGDSFHQGSGQATIYKLADGTHVLRFENFQVINGPDLHVFLSGHPDPTSSSELHAQGELDLGVLKGNIGNQNYEIPADVDVSLFNSVVIYCVPFAVVFSVAALS